MLNKLKDLIKSKDIKKIESEVNTNENMDDIFKTKDKVLPFITAIFSNLNNKKSKEFSNIIVKSIENAFGNYIKIHKNYIKKKVIDSIVTLDSKGNVFLKMLDSEKHLKIGNFDFYFMKEEETKNNGYVLKDKRVKLIEYSYNVEQLVSYYSRRFPEIMNLFEIFSDMCISKGDINIFVKLSDRFINKYFKDVFTKKVVTSPTEKVQSEITKENSTQQQNISNNNEILDNEVQELLNELDKFDFVEYFKDGYMKMMDVSKSRRKRVSSTKRKKAQKENENVIELYKKLYKESSLEFRVLISKIEEHINNFVNSDLVKKIKYAITIADCWGYSIIAIPKSKKTSNIFVYKPNECKIFLPENKEFLPNNLLYVVEKDNGMELLNDEYECFLFSLNPLVNMPVPNIVKISFYLYILDLLETLIIYNDILKFRQLHILEIPVNYDTNEESEEDDILDDLQTMRLIIDSIEDKLALDDDVSLNSPLQSNENIVMDVIKRSGINVAYIPRFDKEGVKNIKLDGGIAKYDTIYNLILEKIYSTIKFPIWFRLSDLLTNLKTLPKEVVKFGHTVLMSRINQAISEIHDLMKIIIFYYLKTLKIKRESETFNIEVSNVYVEMNNIVEDILFDREVTENIRNIKINNIVNLLTIGYPLNPKWVAKYIFPDYDYREVLLNIEDVLNVRENEQNQENVSTDNMGKFFDVVNYMLDNEYSKFWDFIRINVKIK